MRTKYWKMKRKIEEGERMTNGQTCIKIRGHHLVTLKEYMETGPANSPVSKFEADGDMLSEEILSSDSYVKIVSENDCICLRSCGDDLKKQYEDCKTNNELIQSDEKYAEKFGLKIGKVYPMKVIKKALKAHLWEHM